MIFFNDKEIFFQKEQKDKVLPGRRMPEAIASKTRRRASPRLKSWPLLLRTFSTSSSMA